MLIQDFNSDMQQAIIGRDLAGANGRLLAELSKVLVNNKKDFVAMLQESGVEADESMSKSELIEVFLDNTENKHMLSAASYLAFYHNKRESFDGSDEISDDWVKVGYAVLNENFNGSDEHEEDFSYLGAIAIKKLVKEGKKLLGGKDGRDVRDDARDYMQRTALHQQQLLMEQQKMEQERLKQKRKTTTILVIAGGVVLLTAVGLVLYMRNRK